MAANGHIYFTSLDDGVVTVLKAGTSKPEVVSKSPRLGSGGPASSAPADDFERPLAACELRLVRALQPQSLGMAIGVGGAAPALCAEIAAVALGE